MSNEQLEQVEALQAASPMCGRMIRALKGLIKEYEGNKAADTDKYMHSVLQGLEWIFAVYRSTKDIINLSGDVIDQNEVNKSVIRLNEANKADNDTEKAEAFKGILKFVEDFKAEADNIVAAA